MASCYVNNIKIKFSVPVSNCSVCCYCQIMYCCLLHLFVYKRKFLELFLTIQAYFKVQYHNHRCLNVPIFFMLDGNTCVRLLCMHFLLSDA